MNIHITVDNIFNEGIEFKLPVWGFLRHLETVLDDCGKIQMIGIFEIGVNDIIVKLGQFLKVLPFDGLYGFEEQVLNEIHPELIHFHTT